MNIINPAGIEQLQLFFTQIQPIYDLFKQHRETLINVEAKLSYIIQLLQDFKPNESNNMQQEMVQPYKQLDICYDNFQLKHVEKVASISEPGSAIEIPQNSVLNPKNHNIDIEESQQNNFSAFQDTQQHQPQFSESILHSQHYDHISQQDQVDQHNINQFLKYYRTRNGKNYHTIICKSLKEYPYYEITQEEAQRLPMCGYCKYNRIE